MNTTAVSSQQALYKQYSAPANGLITVLCSNHSSLFKQETFLPDRRRDEQALPPQLTNLMEQSRS
jgi:hypothetical protein